MAAHAYYNEHDAQAAAWLRELSARNLITPGDVDERSIVDVSPSDLAGFTQCHFFAGIGVWSYALRCAGWPDDRPVWTGSCPCQPFSASGKGEGFNDPRHLWPRWFRLIREHGPDVCLGEQVASPAGLQWLDLVSADMEGAGYAIGACDTCAAGLGAPHIRQRLYFVAESREGGCTQFGASRLHDYRPSREHAARRAASSSVADANRDGARKHPRELPGDESQHDVRSARGDHASGNRRATRLVADSNATERRRGQLGLYEEGRVLDGTAGCGERPEDRELADSNCTRLGGRGTGEAGDKSSALERLDRFRTAGNVADADRGRFRMHRIAPGDRQAPSGIAHTDRAVLAGFWSDAEWIACTDGKARPVEPGSFPLAHGAPARVGRLRGYGNALCAPQAQAFIEAYLDVIANR